MIQRTLYKHYLLISVVFLIFNSVNAQKSAIRFTHYTTDDGLSQNMVDCILNDSRGYMWFGTWNGLNRFDGYTFSVFKQNSQDPGSISNNFIYALCEDKHGNIWVGTNQGLNVYLYADNKFIHYKSDPDSINSISSQRINTLLCDKDGYIWVGTTKGLDKIEIEGKNGLIKKIVHFADAPGKVGLSDNNIQTLFEDKNGNIWIGTSNGLNVFNQKSRQVVKFFNHPNSINSLSDNNIQSIYCDIHNFAWVGTKYGLNRIHIPTGAITRYYHNQSNPGSIIHNTTMSIAEDLKGRLIFGTLGGISIYDYSQNNFTSYYYRLNDIYGLYSDFVNCLYADREGNIWIGTEKGGINRYNIYQKQFEFFENEPGNPYSLSHNTINSILEDEKHIWIGTAGGGLNKYNKKTGIFKYYKHSANNQQTISSDFVTVLFKDRDQNIWVGTWGGGLNKLSSINDAHGSFSHFPFIDQTTGVNTFDFVSSIIENEDGKLWIGSLGGLILFNPQTGKYENFEAENPNIRVTQVGCLQFDNKKNLWAGTTTGLYRILKKADGKVSVRNCKVEFYQNEPGNNKSIRGDYVISMHRDKKGRMWFGTYGNGINLFSDSGKAGEKGTFTSFTESEGLCNNVIYSILEDNSGNLWLSTDNGLSRFTPATKSFKNYYKTDGLQSNQFYWSANYKNNSGKMYFGGMKGINAFFPDSILDISFPPRTIVTDFKIYNHSVEVGKRYDGRVVLKESISEIQQIELSYKSNEFSFEFSALLFNQPEKIKYMYKLDGFDKQWTQVNSNRRFAIYTNIKGGDYIFMVKAINDEESSVNKPYMVKITIVPPFWVTWWFKLILTVVLVTAIISFYRYRIYSLQRQTRKLEALVKKRTAKIEEQKEELIFQAEQLKESNSQLEKKKKLIEGQKEQLELQNTEISLQRDKLIDLNKKVQIANQQQLNFFTHISHEFRTPLTLIIAPVEQLLREIIVDSVIINKLNLIYKNAQRLLHLINQLMEIRKVETGKTELKTTRDNIVKFVEGISASFVSLANQRQIKYLVLPQKELLEVHFDKEIIENILYNLLSNAFKYTPEQGSVTLTISTVSGKQEFKEDVSIIDRHLYKYHDTTEFVKIEIRDSGIGIAPDQVKDIFRRFYRIHSHQSPKITGSGIGLYLTRELIKTHKGLLYVNSKPDMGTSIKVLLPLGNSHLTEAEILDSRTDIAIKNQDIQVKLLSEQFKPAIIQEFPLNSDDIPEQNSALPRNGKLLKEKPLVLVVDDDHDLCNYIADSLKHSFRIMKAGNGKEGIEKATRYSPDVIISDVMMPEIDGLELCTRIKSEIETSHIPLILLTARSEAENYIEGLETGADDYISKPFNMRIIEAKVKSLIENRKRLRTLFAGSLIPVPREITTTRPDEIFLQKAIKLVEDNIADSEWSVQEMASDLCISRSLLHKKLTAIVGQSAVDFITSIKLKKSALLMHESDLNISEVAYSVGFNDPKYFSRCFKKHFGQTPSEYANLNLK